MPSYTELFTVSLRPVNNTGRRGPKATTSVIEANYIHILWWYFDQSIINHNIQQYVSNIQFTYLQEGVFQLVYTAENDEINSFIGMDDEGSVPLELNGQKYSVSWLPLQAKTESFTVYLDDCSDSPMEVDVQAHADKIINWYYDRMKNNYIQTYAFNILFTHIKDNEFQIKCVLQGSMINIEMLIDPDDDGNHTLKIDNTEFLVKGRLSSS